MIHPTYFNLKKEAADHNNEIIELLSEIKKLGTTNELIDKITDSIVKNTMKQLKYALANKHNKILKESSKKSIEEQIKIIKGKGILEILEFNKDIKLIDRFKVGGEAFIFEGLKQIGRTKKIPWIAPLVEAIKAALKGK